MIMSLENVKRYRWWPSIRGLMAGLFNCLHTPNNAEPNAHEQIK